MIWKSDVLDVNTGMTPTRSKPGNFLKRKTFRLAAQMPPILAGERTDLAFKALDPAQPVTRAGLTALAQAKLAYTKGLLELCNQFRCKVFASIICDPATIPDDNGMLRRDYIYLFERFYYFLEDKQDQHQGIVVFDELDKSASHLVLTQMDRYFKFTQKGRIRSSLIIPEPFFVHSDLTTGIQIVDFAAYILSWSFRYGKLTKDSRVELGPYLELLKTMRYKTGRDIGEGTDYIIWSVAIV